MVAEANSDADTTGAQAGVGNISVSDITDAIKAALASVFSDRSFQQTENVIDVGADESTMRAVVNDGHKWGANEKRAYDEYQELSLSAARRSQDRYDDVQADISMLRKNAIKHFANVDEVSLSRLANGVNNDELAVDRKWNVDEQVFAVEAILRGDVYKEALAAAIAAAVSKETQKA
jgi:hypothetical protein